MQTAQPIERQQDTGGHGPAFFFIALIILSIPFYFLTEISLFPADRPFFPMSALMAFLPSLIALALIWRNAGARRAARLFLAAIDPRPIRLGWWPVVLLLMPGLYALAVPVANLIHPGLGYGVPLWADPMSYLGPFLFLMLFAIGEEIGWQGYVAPRLSARHGDLTAAVIIGVVWAAWHVVPYFLLGRDLWWVIWQCSFTVLFRILIFWAWRNNRGSLLAAEVLHAYSNIGYRSFPDSGAAYDPFATTLVLAAIVGAILLLWGARDLSRLRWARPGTSDARD